MSQPQLPPRLAKKHKTHAIKVAREGMNEFQKVDIYKQYSA